MDRRILFLLALLTNPTSSFAIGSTFQMAESENGYFVADHDGRYDRYGDSYFGATVTLIAPLFDEEGNYLVAPGETWMWIWERVDESQEIHRLSFSYVGGDGMCWSDGYCGPLGAFFYGIKYTCMPEGAYRVSVEHDGAPVGSGDYRPTRFKPHVFDYWYPEYLTPQMDFVSQGEVGEYYLVVSDDLGCYEPLEGVEVSVSTHVVENDLGHSHMNSDYGTGKFITLGYESVVDESRPEITGKTNEYGLYRARYQADKHGVHEKVLTRLKRPATDIDPEIEGPEKESALKIQVPDLVELTAENATVIFQDGGSCPHSPLPHWFTKNSRSRMSGLAAAYQYLMGNQLSVNDASLIYGGVIDNKLASGGGRNALCHVSHRRGIDVDLNKIDSGGVNMLTERRQFGDEEKLIIDWVTTLARQMQGIRHKESTIHYRFPN